MNSHVINKLQGHFNGKKVNIKETIMKQTLVCDLKTSKIKKKGFQC